MSSDKKTTTESGTSMLGHIFECWCEYQWWCFKWDLTFSAIFALMDVVAKLSGDSSDS